MPSKQYLSSNEVPYGSQDKASSNWRNELLGALTSVEDLAREGYITESEAARLRGLNASYQLRIPRYYASLFSDSEICPIKLQAIPSLGEQDPSLPPWLREMSIAAFGTTVPWRSDSIGDVRKLAAPRLTHRYGNRAILHVSSLCAMYCRFCFRKSHLNQKEEALYAGTFDSAFKYLEEHSEIEELILTGGDPLSLNDTALSRLLERIASIANLKIVRIHTRSLVTLPSRVSPELLQTLKPYVGRLKIVTHFNHPNELTDLATSKLFELQSAGISVFNQTVLLRRINDSSEVLKILFQRLYATGVNALYLHHPDWTPGTFHFRVPISMGLQLYRSLRGMLSGPAVPEYVLDIPGGCGKIPLTDSHWINPVGSEITKDGFQARLYQVLPSAKQDKPRLYLDASFARGATNA